MSVLDVGCGKGYLLYEFTQILPGLTVAGIDISQYGIDNAKEEVRPHLEVGNADSLPYPDHSFDLVVSLGVLHNLPLEDVYRAVKEIERVGHGPAKYLMVESFRDEREKANLLYWQLTCLSFHRPGTWAWIYDQCGYTGDHGFIFFE
jgi:protein-L-isoaspartate(D-aspartate) O-methyltransferase